ncbi:uncharacterized protein [Ptychodera flava]|uniref:uncharacterized protein n=1 Tax=Ptychodera flava TaxID=63121 RepID=UPI003969E323
MKIFTVSLLFFGLSCTTKAVVFDNFEDHLAMMEKDTTTKTIWPSQLVEQGSGGGSEIFAVTTANPRPMSCCDIGRIAGLGGFHCNPEYYKPRIQMRNRNRPHNMKLGFHGQEGDGDHKYGFNLMRQFRKCVGGLSPHLENDFHKCCKYAYLDLPRDESEEEEQRRRETKSKNKRRRHKYKERHGRKGIVTGLRL